MTTDANIMRLFAERAALHPDRPAIIAGAGPVREVVTYAQLLDQARRAATLLTSRCLQPGDGVMLLVPMSVDLYVALLGLYWAGLVAVVPASLDRAALSHACHVARPRGLIAVRRAHFLVPLVAALRAIPERWSINGWVPWARSWRPEKHAPAGEPHPCSAESTALITFTSGSTGLPKAAARSHAFLLAQHRALRHSIDLCEGQVDLTTLPIFLLANLASGLTSVIPDADLRHPGAIDPYPVIAQIQRERVTRTVASPALLERLADCCLAVNETLYSLEAVYTGGAPVFPAELAKLERIAPGARVVSVYGSTEAEPIAAIDWAKTPEEDRQAMRGGAGLLAGVPEPCVRLCVVRDRWGTPIPPLTGEQFEQLCEPAGAPGEIVVTGEHVLTGYIGGVGDETTKFRVDGKVWHRTGDAGRLDAQGRLWLLGRCEARIRRPQGDLYPLAVECGVSDVEGLARSALVQTKKGTTLVIQISRGGDEVTIRSAVGERINWAGLDRVVVLPEIPVDRRHNAKIDYPVLRQLLSLER